jgi:ABC-type phosphate transport system substrate-binding protein
MIRKSLAVAIALGLSGSAMAFAPTDTPDYDVNFSGATASTKTLKEVVVTKLCDSSSSIDVYELNGSSKNWGVGCVTNTTLSSGSISAKKVLFRKADLGSGYGVVNVDEKIPVQMIDLSTCGATSTSETVGGVAVNVWQCTAKEAAANSIPDIGTSDVEPEMFKGTLTAGSDYKDLSGMVVKPLSGLAFGVNVTTDLRNALQAAQGLTVGAEDEANMPSLSSQVIRTLFSGKIQSWNDVRISDGAGGTISIVDAANADTSGNINWIPSAAGEDTVHICRRRAGSGTHAQIASLILRTNCSGGVTMSTATALPFLQPQVSAAQGSGDMTDCLDNLGTGSNTAYDGDNPFLNKIRWGIGYQSLEKNADTSAAYRFVKIDGAAPTLENIHAGKYYDFAESTLQRRGGNGDYNSSIVAAGAEADVTAMFEEISVQLAQASNLVSINAGSKFAHPFGQSGWLANPNVSGNTPEDALDLAKPVNVYSHQGENTCQPPIAANGAQILVD